MKHLCVTLFLIPALPACAYLQKEADLYGYNRAPRNPRDVTGYAFPADGARLPGHAGSACTDFGYGFGNPIGPRHFNIPSPFPGPIHK